MAQKNAKKNDLGPGTEGLNALEKPVHEGEETYEETEDSFAGNSHSNTAGTQGAISPTGNSTEAGSSSLKNFRHHPDMENFYRFIYENDLRLEALVILDEMYSEKAVRKAVHKSKSHAH